MITQANKGPIQTQIPITWDSYSCLNHKSYIPIARPMWTIPFDSIDVAKLNSYGARGPNQIHGRCNAWIKFDQIDVSMFNSSYDHGCPNQIDGMFNAWTKFDQIV